MCFRLDLGKKISEKSVYSYSTCIPLNVSPFEVVIGIPLRALFTVPSVLIKSC